MMRPVVLALLVVCGSVPAGAQKPVKVGLRYVQDDKEPRYLALPPARKKLSEGCALSSGGQPLGLTPAGTGVAHGGQTYEAGQLIALRVDGPLPKQSLPYALRVVHGLWESPCLIPGGAMVGSLAGTPVAFIDATMNGRYDDYGQDMMAVGPTRYAYPLSRMVVAGGKAYAIEVSPDGSAINATAYDEPTQTLDHVSQLAGPLKPELTVFARESPDGLDYVPVFGARPAKLPHGSWRLACAAMSQDVWVLGDPSQPPIAIGEQPGVLAWGAPYALAPRPSVEGQGRIRTFTPPGHLKAPKLDERVVSGTFVVMHVPPELVGRAGERYIGPWPRQDRMGTSLADPNIKAFSVSITRDGKSVNAGLTSWMPWDMSGLVQKVRPYWLSYDFPASNYSGTLEIRVSAQSPLFGPVTSQPVALSVSR